VHLVLTDVFSQAWARAHEGWSSHIGERNEKVKMNLKGFRKNRFEAFPLLSRVNNIGLEQGIHSTKLTKAQMKNEQHVHHWAQDVFEAGTTPRGVFEELGPEAEAALCRSAIKSAWFGPATMVGVCKDILGLQVSTGYN
jgi:hypothetical protein